MKTKVFIFIAFRVKYLIDSHTWSDIRKSRGIDSFLFTGAAFFFSNFDFFFQIHPEKIGSRKKRRPIITKRKKQTKREK